MPTLVYGAWQGPELFEHTLPNGLQILVRPDHRAPIVEVQVLYRVGSSYEVRGQTGLSHALEHMMFRGTPKHPDNYFTEEITKIGGQLNAFTSTDLTVYHERVSKDFLELCLNLEADRMRGLTLDAAVFEKEIEVIKEERRLRIDDNPYALTREQLRAVALSGGAYQHPVIGWPDDLQHMKIEMLRDWYKQWYAPNNAALMVVGDVDPATVFSLAERHFGPLKANPSISKQVPLAHPALEPKGERRIEVRAPGAVPMLTLALNLPSLRTAKESWEPYALDLLTGILSNGNSGRLSKALIHKQALAAQAEASYSPFSRSDSLFLFSAVPNGKIPTEDLYKAFWLQINDLQNNLVSADELERNKKIASANRIYEHDFIQETGLEVLEPLGYSLPARLKINWLDQINKISAAQIMLVAKKYFKPELASTANFIPQLVAEGNEHES